MNKTDINTLLLLSQVLSGSVPESNPDFQEWLADGNEKLFKILSGRAKADFCDAQTKDRMFSDISDVLDLKVGKASSLKKTIVYSLAGLIAAGVAACLMLLPGSKGMHFMDNDFAMNEMADATPVLYSSDGGAVSLSGDFVRINKDGTVVMNAEDRVSFNVTPSTNYKRSYQQKVIVPMGQSCTLSLSDGTVVRMNSGSRIIFPSHFTGKAREVILDGEAYFDVSESGSPFIVKSEDLDVEVMGTHFNVYNYSDVQIANVTLVDGSVKICTADADYILKPDDQFVFCKSNHAATQSKADTQANISWINGEYIFKDQCLDEIFFRLSKWYDFNVSFDDPSIASMRFTGSFMKSNNLAYLLDQITSVTDLQYSVDGNMITISK